MSGKKSDPKNAGQKLIASNRRAYFNYHVEDAYEAGIMLTGSEVKSLRDGRVQLNDAYAIIEKGEVFLHHAHIGEYANSGYAAHVPLRTRKLLLHKSEIAKLSKKAEQSGYTLIPLELYFKNGRVKVKLGVCRGKATYDKRAAIRDRDERRAAAREE